MTTEDLPSHAALVERSELMRSQVAAFAAQRGDDVLLWCHLTRLLWGLPRAVWSDRDAAPHPPAELRRGEVRKMRTEVMSRRRRDAPGGNSLQVGGGCLFMANGPNQRSAQAPLYQRFGPLRPPNATFRSPFWRTRRLTRQAVDLVADLIAFARSNGQELVTDSVSLQKWCLRTAKLLAGWEDLLTRQRPRVIVVGSVWQPRGRALLYAARQAGIPTVYVPHCPQRAEPHLIDLVVDYVALRGRAEADFLADHGVPRDRLDVVGDPSIAVKSPPEIDRSLPVVFAPNSELPGVLGPLTDVIREALGDRVVVSRHPSADGGSILGGHWSMHGGRTYDLLKQGVPVLVQQSSGVALEAMQLGIPVIEMQFPGRLPTYPLIRQPPVRFASGSRELEEAVAASYADARDPACRQRLIGWARGWSWPTGTEAGERMIALVERALADGPRRAIWDPWR